MFKSESLKSSVARNKSCEATGQSLRTKSSIEVLVEMLSEALRDDPRFTYVVPDEATRRAILPWYLASAIRVGQIYGEMFVMRSAQGAAIWIRPSATTEFRHILQRELIQMPVKLRTAELRRAVKLRVCVERIRERFARSPHWCLLTLGADACAERDTIAPALIAPVLSRADSEGLSCYLETFRETDLPFYEEYGFRIQGSGCLARSGPNLWILMRAPRS